MLMLKDRPKIEIDFGFGVLHNKGHTADSWRPKYCWTHYMFLKKIININDYVLKKN